VPALSGISASDPLQIALQDANDRLAQYASTARDAANNAQRLEAELSRVRAESAAAMERAQSDYKRELDARQQQLEHVMARVKVLESALAASSASETSLRGEVAALRSTMLSKTEQLETELATACSARDAYQARLSEFEHGSADEASRLTASVALLEQERDALLAKLAEETKAKLTAESSSAELVRSLKTSLEAKSSELHVVKQRMQELEASRKSSGAAAASAAAALDESRTHVAQLQQKLDATAADLASANAQIAQTNEQLHQCRRAAASAEQTLISDRERIASLELALAAARTSATSSPSPMVAEPVSEGKPDKFKDLAASLAEKDRLLSQLRQERASDEVRAREVLEQARNDLAIVKKSLEEARANEKSLHEGAERDKAKLSDLQRTSAEQAKSIVQLRVQVDGMKRLSTSSASNMMHKDAELQDLRQQLSTVQAELAAAQARIQVR
jgi:chromosome segregation ATPase